MNSDVIQRELNLIEADKKLSDIAIEAEKEAFAQQIRMGLGETIKQEANVANKPVKMKIPKKHKIKRFFKRIKSVFSDEDVVEN